MTPEQLAALARSHSTVAAERYDCVALLAGSKDPYALRRLVEMLADDEDGHDDSTIFDDDSKWITVAEGAQRELAKILPDAWPALVEAYPREAVAPSIRILELLRDLPPADRLALPADAHDALAARVDHRLAEHHHAAIVFEGELARKLRDGEVTREGAWQLWLRDHPSQRGAAIQPLVACGDPSSVAQQLVELLEDPVGYAAACALRELLPVLDEQWVRAIVQSEWPARFPILLPHLAARGEIALPILPICVACCDPKSSIRMMASAKLKLGCEALKAFGPLAASARPALLDLFLAVDEPSGNLEPSPRWALVQLLGRDRLVEELRDRIDQLPEPDWYAKMRKRECRKALGLPV